MRRSVLVVAPYLPLPADFGGALRIYHLVKEVAKVNDVILLASRSGDEFHSILELGEICDVTTVPVRSSPRQPATRRKRLAQLRSLAGHHSFLERSGYIPQMQTALERLFQTRRIDLVQFEFPQSALYRLPIPVPTIFDAHNVEYRLLLRAAGASDSGLRTTFNAIEFARLRRLERSLWHRSTVCVATSQRDAATIEAATRRDTPVVPNGVDYQHYASIAADPQRPNHIVFTGAMRHQPNADGAIWFVRNIVPLVRKSIPNVTLTIAGADPPPAVRNLASSDVTVTGYVTDIRDQLAPASVVVVPLHSGGGTRLKILEAFAAARPVVSTTLGAEGLNVNDGEHLTLADSPRGFATSVVRVLTDRHLARSLADTGQNLARDQYDWSAIAPALIEAHDLAIERFSDSQGS